MIPDYAKNQSDEIISTKSFQPLSWEYPN